MAAREKPASTARTRPARKNPVRRGKPAKTRTTKPGPRGRADDMLPVVLKEENGDGLTARELQRRLAVRAAVSPAFLAALARDFTRHGAEAIAKTRELAPATYFRLAAVLLPMDAAEAAPLPAAAAPGAKAEDEQLAAAARRIAELHELFTRLEAEEAEAGEEGEESKEGQHGGDR
jgi:hypothetical protein